VADLESLLAGAPMPPCDPTTSAPDAVGAGGG
jgi:hypothetical protein